MIYHDFVFLLDEDFASGQGDIWRINKMFRLAEFTDEGGGSLYKYLSSTASKVIWNALDIWAGSRPAILDVYVTEFCEGSESGRNKDFFEGISLYISEETVRSDIREMVNRVNAGDVLISRDGMVGMEFLARKISRMKDKMADPVHYHTFDLFEEYLFSLMVEAYDPEIFAGEEDPYVITTDGEVEESARKLYTEFQVGEELEAELEEPGIGKEYAAFLARSIHRVDSMSLWTAEEEGFGSLFFWDDDYEIVFGNGFVDGIRALVSGQAKILGYGYKDVECIFTDIGLSAPLLLVGTEAAFDVVGETVQGKMEEAMKDFTIPGIDEELMKRIEADKDELPFS